jgi:hypothetical protein
MDILRQHPANPKLLQYADRPLVLLCATEHYGSVMNRPFNFGKYLADAAKKRQTLTRLFLLFRELQSAMNPYSPCKPESTDYISPFERSGPGDALDGLPRYDLARWNPEFFERLHAFMSLAEERGIMVEVVLFSHSYSEEVWSLNPLHPANNLNGLPAMPWHAYTTRRNERLFDFQRRYLRKIVTELNRYGNIIYEICNEPGGNFPYAENTPPSEEVDEWMEALLTDLRGIEAKLPNQHLVAGQQAFKYILPGETAVLKDVHQFCEASFDRIGFDIVNMHPLSNMWHRGVNYDLGRFMRGELRLRALRDYCLAMYRENKPLNLDEDNAASRFTDDFGWTIHRKRAWTALFCGAHYDVIDFSINKHFETGTAESNASFRNWMKILSETIHAIDLVRARPDVSFIAKTPPETCVSALVIDGEIHHIYLADAREKDNLLAGNPIKGQLVVNLPKHPQQIRFVSPVTGKTIGEATTPGGDGAVITLPPFQHDLLIGICKRDDGAKPQK